MTAKEQTVQLTKQYAEKIKPLLVQAKKAYGSRDQVSPAHNASRQYTKLLIEYKDKGGSLPEMARALKVAYAGVRRRVAMADVSVSETKPKRRVRLTPAEMKKVADRVQKAKKKSVEDYHDQLAEEYESGVSLSALSKALGLSSAAPLYYGVQRSQQRARK